MVEQLAAYEALCGGLIQKLSAEMPTLLAALRAPTSAYLSALGHHQKLAADAVAELSGGSSGGKWR